MSPEVEGVCLSLRAERVVLSLPELEQSSQRRASTVRPPRITVPDFEGRFKLRPMRLFALRELLHIAWAGRAQARIPLVPTTLRKGPFSIEIPEQTELVIDAGVENAHFVFDGERTRGVIEPAIKLPLGLTFRGVNIREDGSVVADVSKLPIDISWIRFRRLRIPASLEEINEFLERREEAAASEAPEDEGGLALPLDYANMTVLARDVIPRPGELALGEAGSVELLEGSKIDVDYTPDTLTVRGHMTARADISGSGFLVKGARLNGRASAELRRPKGHSKGTAVELGCEQVSSDEVAITLPDGSLFELRDVSMDGLHIWVRRLGQSLDWRFACKKLRAKLSSGMLMVWIAGRAYELHFGECEVEGSISLSSTGHEVNLEILGAVLRMGPLHLDLGAADLSFGEVHARTTGHLRFTSVEGAEFTGMLSVNADLDEGWLWAGPLRAHLLDETAASANITHIAVDRDGLRDLTGTGTVELQLASGSIPIGRTSELGFSRGATGTLAIHSFSMSSARRWPKMEAGAQLTAQSDPLDLQGITLPSGMTQVEIARIECDPSGSLSLGEIDIMLEGDGGDQPTANGEDLGATVDLPEPAVGERSYDSVEVDASGEAEV